MTFRDYKDEVLLIVNLMVLVGYAIMIFVLKGSPLFLWIWCGILIIFVYKNGQMSDRALRGWRKSLERTQDLHHDIKLLRIDCMKKDLELMQLGKRGRNKK